MAEKNMADDYKELAIKDMRNSNMCPGFRDYLLEELEDQEKEIKTLKRKLRRIKKQADIMQQCKTVDVTGGVKDTGKFIVAYNELQKLVKEKL